MTNSSSSAQALHDAYILGYHDGLACRKLNPAVPLSDIWDKYEEGWEAGERERFRRSFMPNLAHTPEEDNTSEN